MKKKLSAISPRILVSVLFAFLLMSAFSQQQSDSLYSERFRPQFHFTPKKNWINDPNGLLFYEDTYHLFYQYNPYANVWGHMTWAHAVSEDLIHWVELPTAIPETKDYMIFSGSAVADINNTAGFANNDTQIPLVAIYTAHTDTSQKQNLAYSLDKGLTWHQYNKNPVLDLGKKDFRDPGAFWYSPDQKWIMAVMFPQEHEIKFYSSSNLKEWNFESSFGPAGDTSGVWECPQLMKVPMLEAPGNYKWVLMLSMNAAMQYFVGDFDGHHFVNENVSTEILRPDYGPDYYAAIAYNNLPENQNPITIGWINNWNYANDIPVAPWKGAMSLPRKLSVDKINGKWALLQTPVLAVEKLRRNLFFKKNIKVTDSITLPVTSQTTEIEFALRPNGNISGIKLASGNNQSLIITYNPATHQLTADRTTAGYKNFNSNFEQLNQFSTYVPLHNGKIKLHIFFDKSIVEIFANDGSKVITLQLFPDEKNNGIELFSNSGTAVFCDLKIWEIRSIWP